MLKGYSRYGEWIGNPYGDWNNSFMLFCLNYAGVDSDILPQAEDCSAWKALLKENDLYKEADDYTPQAGDIVFLDTDEDDVEDRVAVVTAAHSSGITVIEGDAGSSDNSVTKIEISVSEEAETEELSSEEETATEELSTEEETATEELSTEEETAMKKLSTEEETATEERTSKEETAIEGLTGEEKTVEKEEAADIEDEDNTQEAENEEKTDKTEETDSSEAIATERKGEESDSNEESMSVEVLSKLHSDVAVSDKVEVSSKTASDTEESADEEETPSEDFIPKKETTAEHEEKLNLTIIEYHAPEDYKGGVVQYTEYSREDTRILGYGVLPDFATMPKVYTYSDDIVEVEVTLPEDSSVPADAKLSVKHATTEADIYDILYKQAQAAVDGEVKQIAFYDISFYTTDLEYIPVDDTAQVTMRFKKGFDLPSNEVFVLHYDEADSNPTVISEVNVGEKSSAARAVPMATFAMERESTGVTISYETEGFSWFAAIEIQIPAYTMNILSPDAQGNLPNLDGKIIMISTAGEGAQYALSAENVDVYEEYNGAIHHNHRLKAIPVTQGAETVSATTGDINTLLWKFIAVEGAANTYRMQSVKYPNLYLKIYQDNRRLETVTDADEGISNVVQAGTTNEVFSIKYHNFLAYEELPLFADAAGNQPLDYKVFTTLKDPNERGNLTFSEYTDGSEPPAVDAEYVNDLGGKYYMLLAVNYKDNISNIPSAVTHQNAGAVGGKNALTSQLVNGFDYENDEITDKNFERYYNLVWLFEKTGTGGAYYIKDTESGNYLNLNENGLSLSATKQAIEVVKAAGFNNHVNENENAVCLRAGEWYLNLNNNTPEEIFTSNDSDNTINDRANHFVLASFRDVNAMIEDIDEILAGLVEVENADGTTSYVFDDNLAGAAKPDKVENTVNQGKGQDEETFEKNFNDAIAYRNHISELAVAAKLLYDQLTEHEKGYVYNREALEKLEWLWREAKQVESDEVNVTVRLFNYDKTVNETELAKSGFQFYHQAEYHNCTAEDGSNKNNGILGANESDLDMGPKLNEEGYPYIVGSDEDNIKVTGESSFQELFEPKNKYQVGEMSNGGGLFRFDGDYYYYESNRNSAYFDKEQNKFILYDTLVRPMYIHANRMAEDQELVYNFLPFNNPASTTNPIIFDETPLTGNQNMPTAVLNEPPDLWFGMYIEYEFYMPDDGQVYGNDMIFNFHGDDDVFVYIDDTLVLDIGGTHGAQSGSINFATGEVSDPHKTTTLGNILDADMVEGDTLIEYTEHKLRLYYLERGGNSSYNGMQFNLPPLPQEYLFVSKQIIGAGEDNEESFRLRVLNADDKSNAFAQGTTYDIIEDGQTRENAGTVDADGSFSIKHDQIAVFSDSDMIRENSENVIVQEILTEEQVGSYSVTYRLTGDTAATSEIKNTTEVNNTYSTGNVERTGSQFVAFRNTLKCALNITKEAAAGTTIAEDEEFNICVKLDGKLIPAGTEYLLHDSDGTYTTMKVETEGFIRLKVDQTATIDDVIAGTRFEIYEDTAGNDWNPSYSGEITCHQETSQNRGQIIINDTGVSGSFGNVSSTVDITVTNDIHSFSVGIPIRKKVDKLTGPETFFFTVEEYQKVDGAFVPADTDNPVMHPGISITMAEEDAEGTGTAVIGFAKDDEGTHYYKISEERGTGDYIYDTIYYIAEVVISEKNDKKEALMKAIRKNGKEELEDIDAGFELVFINRLKTELVIDKTVVGTAREEKFDFILQNADGSTYELFNELPEGATYDEAEDCIRFSVKYGNSITFYLPVNAKVSVTEEKKGYYGTSYFVSGEQKDIYYAKDAVLSHVSVGSSGLVIEWGDDNDSCTFTVNSEYAGKILLYYSYATDEDGSFDILVNGKGPIHASAPANGSLTVEKEGIPVAIDVKEGENIIVLADPATGTAPNLEYIRPTYPQEGNRAELTVLGATKVGFMNSYEYEIPETGGSGVTPYILGGLLAMLSSMALLLLYKSKQDGRRKGET